MDASAFSKDGEDYSAADGNANYAAINALKTALAASLTGLSANNIQIISVTTTITRKKRRNLSISDTIKSLTALKTLPGTRSNRTPTQSVDVSPSGVATFPQAVGRFHADRRRLASACVVVYIVIFVAEEVGYTDTNVAYVLLATELQTAQSSGDFATALEAAADMYNAGELAAVSIAVLCESDDPNYCSVMSAPVFDQVTPAPSHQPTFKPTGTFSQEALAEWSPYKVSLVTGIGGFFLLAIPLALYSLRHYLPGVSYKRRGDVMKDRARKESSGYFGQAGVERVHAPIIVTLDDLLDIDLYSHTRGVSSGHGSDYGGQSVMSDLSERSLSEYGRSHRPHSMPGDKKKKRLSADVHVPATVPSSDEPPLPAPPPPPLPPVDEAADLD